MHDAEDWSKAFVGVVPRSGFDIIAQPWGPERPFFVQLAGLDEPFLTAVELSQPAHEFVGWRFDYSIHGGGNIGSRTHFEGLDGVDQLVHETLRLADAAHHDDERRCGALLPRVAEGRPVNIGHGEVRISRWRDDDSVLA